MIDQPTIDRVLDTANIVDIVSEFVTLRKRGISYVGLCPFRSDKSPSFYVSPSKNICKCFTCEEGRTAVHFIMKHEQLSYFDTLRSLAKKCNIEIQERELTEKEKQIHSDRESMLIVNSWAGQYFSTLLHEYAEGKSVGTRYSAERGLREGIIRKSQLGYSLDQRDTLYKTAIKAGYKREFLEKTDSVIVYDNGNVNDRFRGRVIFPVHTLSGKIVALGGRVLKKDEKTAKYVNSPESEIYHKSNELYGIYFAKQAIMKQDRCFSVEGHMDVVGMHQMGAENVVASSGTALMQGQIRLIHRFTNNITVLYDGDAAGIKAALRGIDMLLEERINVKVVLLPAGEDLDSFACSHNVSEFAESISQNETDFIRFKTKSLLAEAGGDPIRRSALISDIIRTAVIIPDNIARSVYIREYSTTMEIDEQVLLNEVNKIRLNKEESQVAKSIRNTPPVQSPVNTVSEYPDFPSYQPYTPEEANTPPPENIPPPPPEDYIPEEEASPSPTPPYEVPAVLNMQVRPKHSPSEAYELALLRYIVRYGERVLHDYVDEGTNEHVIVRVADYIRFDLKRNDLTFYTSTFKQVLDKAAEHYQNEGFMATHYFLAHPNPNISRFAANPISDKYQLSKYRAKFRELEQEEDKLDYLVPREIYSMKDTYILYKIKDIQAKIKETQNKGDMGLIFDLMEQNAHLNEIRNVLCKGLGERIVLKV